MDQHRLLQYVRCAARGLPPFDSGSNTECVLLGSAIRRHTSKATWPQITQSLRVRLCHRLDGYPRLSRKREPRPMIFDDWQALFLEIAQSADDGTPWPSSDGLPSLNPT